MTLHKQGDARIPRSSVTVCFFGLLSCGTTCAIFFVRWHICDVAAKQSVEHAWVKLRTSAVNDSPVVGPGT